MREARVVIIGGGFAGLNCARQLARRRDVSITLIDRRNYHLFQPLLYQVAMAGLSPGDIASPIRGLFSRRSNVHVVQGEVEAIQWSWSYLTFARGTRLIVEKEWRSHANRRLAAPAAGTLPEGWDELTTAYPSVREG